MGKPNDNKPVNTKPVSNPLLGSEDVTPINPLTGTPITGAPMGEDSREKRHFQTTPDLVPNLDHISAEDLGEYADYGVSMFPQLEDTWQHQRAENQSGWGHLTGFLNQAIVGEVVGGTIEGIGWLFEMDNWGKLMRGETEDVGNFMTELGEGLQEWTQDVTPIHTDPQDGAFAPWSSAWWASSGVSVASFASMLIPAAGTVRAVSLVGKGLGVMSKLGKMGKALGMSSKAMKLMRAAGKGIATATVSRHLENNMEASGVYKEQYQKFVNNGIPEDKARQLAGEAAADTYNKNWAMLVQDIPQYMLLGGKFKMPNLVNKGLSKVVGKGAAAALTNKYVGSALSEGFEEGYQFWVGEEAKHMTDVKAGLAEENSYSERMGKYLENGEFWTSVFFGALGGTAFEFAGPRVQAWSERNVDKMSTMPRNLTNHLGARINHIKETAARNQFYSDAIIAADEAGNDEVSTYLKKKWNIDTAISKLEEGTFPGYVKDLEGMRDMSEEERKAQAEKMGLEPENFLEYKDNYKDYITDANRVKEIYSNLKKDGYTEATLGAMTIRSMDDAIASDRASHFAASAANRRQSIKGLDKITAGSGEAVMNASIDLARVQAGIAMYEKRLKSEDKQARIDRIQQRIKDLRADQKEAEKTLKEAEEIERTPAEKRADKRVINRALKDKALMRDYNAVEFNEMLSDEAQEEIDRLQSDEVQKATKYKSEIDSIRQANTPGEYKMAVDRLREEYNDRMPPEIENAIKFKGIAMELEQKKAKAQEKANANEQDLKNMKEVSKKAKEGDPMSKEMLDGDKARRDMQIEGKSAAETKQAGSNLPTEQNIDGAVRAKESAQRKNYNQENIATVLKGEPVQSELRDKTKKTSMLTMNWKSVTNGAENNSQNKVLTEIFESPTSPVGKKVEFVVVEDGIRAILLNEAGDWVTANGDPVGPYIHKPDDQIQNANWTEAKRSQLAALIATIEEADANGQRVFTEISHRTGGHVIRGNEAHSVKEIVDAIGYSPKVVTSIGGALLYHQGNEVTNTTATHTAGHTMLELFDLNGNPVVEALDTESLTVDEANMVVTLFAKFSDHKLRFNSYIEGVDGMENLTYGEALEMLVFEGKRTFNTTNKDGERMDLGLRTMNQKYVLQFGSRTIPVQDINSVRKDIVDFLTTHAARYVSIKKTNLPMTAGTKSTSFTFMGQQYSSADQYNTYLFESGKVKTKLSPVNGKAFRQPTIEFSPAFEITEAQAAAPVHEEQVAQAEETLNEQAEDAFISEEEMDKIPEAKTASWGEVAKGGAKEAEAPVNPFGNVKRKKSRFSLAPSPDATFEVINIEEARTWLSERLPDVPVEAVEGWIKASNKGAVAEGAFVNGMIKLSNLASQGTEYHEAFHAVSQLLLDENQRNELYAEARARYGAPTAEQLKESGVANESDWLEERLADDFRAYVHSEGTMKFGDKTGNWFQRLWNMIKGLFGSKSKTDRVFNNINTGYYATAEVSDRVRAMADKTYYSKINGLTVTQTYDLVDTMMFNVVDEANLMEAEDISAITMEIMSEENLSGYLADYYDKAMAGSNPQTASIFIAAHQEVGKLRQALIEKFDTMNLKFNEEVERILDSDVIEEEEKTEKLNTKPAFEYSGKDAATGNVKLLLATLPKLRSLNMVETSEGMKRDYAINPRTGLPRMASPSATWSALAKKLSGIVDTYEYSSGRIDKAFDKMLTAMDELTMTRPEISFITERLRDPNYPMYKKVEFFSAFSKAKMNFYTARFKKDGKVKKFKFGKSDSRNAAEQIRNEWAQSFKDRFYTFRNNEAVLDTEKLAKPYALITSLQESVQEAIQMRKKAGIPVDVEALSSQLFGTLRATGIEMSDSSFEYWMETQEGSTPEMQLKNAITSIALTYTSKRDGIQSLITRGMEPQKGWVKNENRILKLAEVEALFRDDMSEAGVLGADNAMYYAYASNNFLTKKLQEIKNNDEYLQKLADVPYNSNSIWIQELMNDPKAREKFDYNVFNNFREEAAGDTGNKYSDLKPADEFALRINQTLTGRFSLLTAADKGVYVTLTGPSVKSLGKAYRKDGSEVFNNVSSVDILGNYFIDELARMEQAWNEIYGENAIPAEQRDQFYHDKMQNAFRSQLFPSLSPLKLNEKGEPVDNVDKETLAALGLYDMSNNNKPTWSSTTVAEIRFKVEKLLESQIQKEIDHAVEVGVLKRNNGTLTNVGLDSKLLADYRGKAETAITEEQAIKSMMSDYVLNSIIANIETTKMFTGDPAYYKSLDDLKKRVPGIIAPGQDLFIHEASDGRDRKQFKVAIVKDIETKLSDTNPDIYNDYVEALKESYMADGMAESTAISKAKKALSAYDEVNEADAQAYVTLDRYRDLLEMLGKWRPSMETQFNRLKKGQTVDAKSVASFMQPLKGMYYDLVPTKTGGRMKPVYLKYSLAPLLPGMTRGTKMDAIRQKMEAGKIDELVFNSGIKVGAQGVVDINDVAEGRAEFNPMPLDNRNWKLQQDLSAKYMKKGKAIEGSQVIKNVLANIDVNAMYGQKTGAEVIQDFVEADRRLSNLGREQVIKEFGFDFQEEGDFLRSVVDKEKLYPHLISELKGEAPRFIIEALEQRVSLDAIPQFRKKIQQKLLSMVNKRTVKLDMPGGSFIQMSPVLFEKEAGNAGWDNSDILWLNNTGKLQPPRRTKDGKVRPGQVLVPHSLTKNIDGFDSMSRAEQITALKQAKDAGLLEGVGYRIPNQDMASTDYLEIAGVLPAYMGDTIVAYPSVTAKTGSDYDIDKMYFMMPNYEVENGMIKKVTSDVAGGVKAVQNAKLDAYKQILTSPNTFSRLVTPIDADWLKNDAKAIRKLKNRELRMDDMQFFTGLEQYVTKRKFGGGKHGIGQNANHMVDHVLTQLAGVYITKDFGIGHSFSSTTSLGEAKEKGGNRYITSNISAYLNANVDIAKDPYIFDLNNNTFTANTVMMLLRMGAKPEWVNRFMTQPIIEEYTNLHLNSEGRVNELDFDEKTKKPIKPIDIIEQKYPVKDLIPLSKDSIPNISSLEAQLQSPTDATQRQLLDLFLELQDFAKGVNLQLRASKSDTKGAGRTLVEAMIFENTKLAALADTRIGNVEKKFEGTMLDAYYENSVQLVQDALGGEFVGMSTAVKSVMEQVGLQLGHFNLTDGELAQLMEDEIYTYLMKDFPLFKHENPREMFIGDNTMGQRLEFLKTADSSPFNNESHPLFDNLLLKNLSVKRAEVRTEPDFIDILGSSKRDAQAKEALSEAWGELLESDEQFVVDFATDLIKYSFYSTGLNQTGSSFFDVIPTDYLLANDYDTFINSLNNLNTYVKSQDVVGAQGVGQLQGFVGRFFRNNWSNNKIVPTVSKKARIKIQGINDGLGFMINENTTSYVVGVDQNNRNVFYPYVKDGDTLYRLQGYRDSAKTRNAVYARAAKRGYSEGRFRIKDYDQKPLDLAGAPGVELIEGKHYNAGYQYPVAKAGGDLSQQRESMMDRESLEVMNSKIALLRGMFNAEFVLDENLDGVGQVRKGPDGRPIITINPREVRSDTVIHEVAHIYIDSLGGLNDPLIRAGLQQLAGSTAEEYVDSLYPDLSGDHRAKEILATAIGWEGSKLFADNQAKKNRWNNWMTGFWAKVKAFFGIQPNVAKQMAREILTDRIRKGEHSLSEYVQQQRSEASEENADDLADIQSIVNQIKAAIQLKVNIHAKRADATTSEEKEAREKHVESLNKMMEALTKADDYEGILHFIEKAETHTKAIGEKLSNYWEGDKKMTLSTVREMRDYVETYKIVDDVYQALFKVPDSNDPLNLKFKENLSTILERIESINTNFKRIDTAYHLIAKSAIVENLLPYSTRNANLNYRTKYREEFQTNIENQGNKKGKELRAWKERRDSWVNERMAENAKEIENAERNYLYDLIEESKADLNWFDSHVLDPRGVNHHMINLAVRQLDRIDYLTMREFQDVMRDAFTTYEEFLGSTGIGPTDQKALYDKILEKDAEGNITGNYVSEFRETDYQNARKEFFDKLNKREDLTEKQRKREIAIWFNANVTSKTINGEKVQVPSEKWRDKRFEALKNDEKAYKMYKVLMDVNTKADAKLPVAHRLGLRLPGIKASTMEQFKNNGVKEALKEWRDSTFVKEADDTDLGMNAENQPDSEENAGQASAKRKAKKMFAFTWANEKMEESRLVPIFFRKKLGTDIQSYDLFGMAMSNFYMSSNFENKSKGAMQLEVMRDLIKQQKVGETKNWQRKMVAGLGLGNLIPIQKKDTSNISKLMDSLLDDRLYGIREIDAGNINLFGRTVSINKLSKMLSGMTSDVALIGNYASAAANLTMGHVQTFIEAGSRTFYDRGNVKNAFTKYHKDSGAIVADIGAEEHIVKSKTNLLLEHFDMQGEFSALHTSMIKDNKLKRLATKRTAHGLNSIAEHSIQGVLMYALLDNIKVMNSNGEFLHKSGTGTTKDVNEAMSLDEAYTAKDGKLVLDERVAKTTRNRNTESFGIEEEAQISGYLKFINADLNGNYDPNNRSIIQRHILGQQTMLMKKWIPRSMKRRFRGLQYALKDRAELEEWQRYYNEYTGEESEGLYTTAVRYLNNVRKSFNENKFQAFSKEWERMDDMQKGNLARMKWESGIMMLAWLSSMLLAGLAEDDDDNQGIYFMAYMLRRVYAELSFFTNPHEMVKLIQNPLLSMRTLSNLFVAISGVLPWNISERYASGEHEGELKVWNKWKKVSPIRAGMSQFDRDFEKSYNYLLRGF